VLAGNKRKPFAIQHVAFVIGANVGPSNIFGQVAPDKKTSWRDANERDSVVKIASLTADSLEIADTQKKPKRPKGAASKLPDDEGSGWRPSRPPHNA